MKQLTIGLLLICATCWIATAQKIETGSVLIKNGTLLTITDGVKENTDILIENGKIKRIAANIGAKDGMKVINAEGQFVMPGIIDAHSHIAIDAVNEATSPVTSEVFVGDAINPFDIAIYRALAGGVTISHAMHGSANVIGGECETIKHRWGNHNPQVFKMKNAPRTIKFALGENPMRVHGEGNNIQPRTRMGVEQVFRDAFELALAYKKDKERYANRSNDNTIMPPKYSRRLETLVGILDGDVIIHCHSYRADEIYMLLNVLGDYGVKKICFQHVNEGYKVAPELAEYGATASVFSDWWAYKFEVYYSTAYNAAILTENGVITSINSDSGELIRHLYHEAAKTQRYGSLEDNEALKLITLNPAIQLGIDERVGSLEVGKDGDIAIFNAHPLSVYAIPQMTIVDGIVRFDIKEDNDDMRMEVDPENAEPTYTEYLKRDQDRCMQDVYAFFGIKSSLEHKH
ncbi:MAG: amidohydrolase family protein [Bacteroidota bacterium]